VYKATRDERYLNGFLRGVDYILSAQMPNGCWPQVYPLQGSYHDAATFNDDMMAHILRLFRDIGRGTLDAAPEAVRTRVRVSFDRGIDCLLSSQVLVNGKRTVWGAQHDPLTMRPAKARAYEHASLSGGESVELVEVLMEIPEPNARTVHAVHSAMGWFERTAISGFEYKDARLIPRAGAPPIWARFYEIGTDRPLFSNRDGRVLYDYAQLDEERREGYAWFRESPRALLERYARWLQRYPRPAGP
jgi:PelA/Pel-15E family pectate lyase